jgi:hypothetical protein
MVFAGLCMFCQVYGWLLGTLYWPAPRVSPLKLVTAPRSFTPARSSAWWSSLRLPLCARCAAAGMLAKGTPHTDTRRAAAGRLRRRCRRRCPAARCRRVRLFSRGDVALSWRRQAPCARPAGRTGGVTAAGRL